MARRSFFRACAVGGMLAAITFGWMCSIGQLDLLQPHSLAGFYDAQAHSLLDGHWDIPAEQLGFEAFVIDGKAYTYFGPWPTVARLPIAAVTDRYDGRLTQLSILAAFAVLLVATSRLLWRIRTLARGDAPVTRAERWAAGLFVLVVGAGSVVLFLASRPVVYHEAELWGAAWSIAAFAALLGFVAAPDRRSLLCAGAATTLALMTRSSVGLGPLVALGLIFAGRILAVAAARFARPTLNRPARMLGLDDETTNRSYVGPLFAALAIPVALYAYVNVARFGHPFRLPIDKQVATLIDPVRPKIFAGTNGNLFAFKFVPTNLVNLLRPDAIAVDGVFPWITFPERPRPIGDITFASINNAASLPASMPFLFVLSVVGLVAVLRHRARDGRFAGLRILVAGGVVAGLGVLTIPFIDHRYLSDLLPLLVVLGGAGGYAVLARLEQPRDSARPARAVTVAILVLLAALSLWINFALALVYQREYSPFTGEAERAAFVRFQQAAPGGSNLPVRSGPELPEPLGPGTLFVVDECAGVYWSDGVAWHPIERTHATGRYPLVLTLPDQPVGTRRTLMTAGAGDERDELAVEYLDTDTDTGEDRVRFRFTAASGEAVGEKVKIDRGRTTPVEVVYDDRLGRFDVAVGGRSVLGAATLLAGDPVEFSDAARVRDAAAPFCRELTGS